jgi:hypothetical protein
MTKALAIRQLKIHNPKFLAANLKIIHFKVPQKGIIKLDDIIGIYIDEDIKSAIIYKNDIFWCAIKKYNSKNLQSFIQNKILPDQQTCIKILT